MVDIAPRCLLVGRPYKHYAGVNCPDFIKIIATDRCILKYIYKVFIKQHAVLLHFPITKHILPSKDEQTGHNDTSPGNS